jgi:hypothetical protein
VIRLAPIHAPPSKDARGFRGVSTRATYRCACGWSTRRLAYQSGIECIDCGAIAFPADPTPGRPPAAPELARVELRVRPIGISVQVLGVDESRRIGTAAIDEAAKRKRESRNAKARRA